VAVRVCYLSRGPLGASLRSLRLVGQASDERWPEGAGAGDIEHGAAWVRARLSSLRSTDSLALLCLDVEGGVCSWITAPNGTPAMVAALARGGALGPVDGEATARSGSTPLDFYAGDGYSSTIQPLERAGVATESHRMPVLAIGDVPARLLMDALDRMNISVEAAATLWHVMAHVWDPGAPRASAPAVEVADISDTAPITAALIVDPENGRLLWTWSRAGRLLVAGSMRLRRGQAESTAIVEHGSDEASNSMLLYGADDIARLTVEWLSWGAQVGQAPSRIVCVMTDPSQAGAFGRALGQAWTGASVDVVIRPDPVGETLARAANILENTPGAVEEDPQVELVELSSRPGRSHRRLYVWWAAAVMVGAILLAGLGWQLAGSAEQASTAAAAWREQQDKVIAQVMPGAKPGLGEQGGLYSQLEKEVRTREKALQGPAKGDTPMPILEELETLSFVIGNNGLELESIDLDSRSGPRFTVLAPTTRDAEELGEALKRVSGSHVVEWTAQVQQPRTAGSEKVRGTYNGKWAAPKPEGGPR
jgi:hypothetical protein